jgi:hypothetical protein
MARRAANQAAINLAIVDATEVGQIGVTIMDWSARQRTVIHENGWDRLEAFRNHSTTDVSDWIRVVERRAANAGGARFGTVAKKRLQALNYWVNNLLMRGRTPLVADFTDDALEIAMEDHELAIEIADRDEEAQTPKLFKYDDWIDWQQSVVTYLKAKKGVRGVPLYYVIRPEPNVIPLADMTEDDEIIYHASHDARSFTVDSQTVHRTLEELTIGTDAAEWIKEYRRGRRGREAWIALCGHYDGPAEGDKRVAVARSNISKTFYKNETTFSFEKYSTRLKKSFDMLRQYGQPKSHKEEVEILLNQINTNNLQLVSSIQICRNAHNDDFIQATTYLSTQIAQIFPQAQPGADNRRPNNRGGGGRNRRNVNKLKKVGGKSLINGVDVSDTTRYYTQDEMTKLGPDGRQHLYNCPKREQARQKRRTENKNKRKSGVSSVTFAEDDTVSTTTKDIAAAVVNGVMHAHRENNSSSSDSTSTSSSAQMPQHGPHASATVSAMRSTRPRIRYNHLGNVI